MKTASMLIATVLFAACASPEPYDTNETDDADKADSSVVHPAGRYTKDDAAALEAGVFDELTLNADKTYGGHQFIYCNAMLLAGCGTLRGTYKFTSSGSKHYLRVYGEDGEFIRRFQYKVSGGTLQLKPMTDGGTWTTLDAVDGDTFVADAKDAFLNTPSDQMLQVQKQNAPAAAQADLDQEQFTPTLLRFQSDGMSVWAVRTTVTDASWVKLFDETGLIATGNTDFAGRWHWQQ